MSDAIVKTLQNQLLSLRQQVQQAHPDGRTLQQSFLVAQQGFQQDVLPLLEADWEPAALAQVQPILTEMNRTLRLLGMDVAFLQTARQSMTTQQRQRQMIDRLEQLEGFCQGLLGVMDGR